jgi:hypothetical protein
MRSSVPGRELGAAQRGQIAQLDARARGINDQTRVSVTVPVHVKSSWHASVIL